VVNAGESSLRQGDHIEANELRRLNERLRKEKKRQMEVEPYSFYLSAWEEDAIPSRRPTSSWTRRQHRTGHRRCAPPGQLRDGQQV